MKKLKFLSLLAGFVLSIASVNAQEAEANAAITLERTACRGFCPIYTVTIFENGTVRYSGENFVEVTGEQITEIDPETVDLMVEAFEDAGYFTWDEAYETQAVSDLTTVITSVTRNGETHRIVHYAGDFSAPLALSFLEQWIDKMANTHLWTGIQPDVASISNGTDTPFVTLKRGICFGPCPMYSIALFEDGTIVYTGVANVDEIGVHIFETDPSNVTSIAQQAQIIGYFDWQDSYEARIKTDQATVITSIRWEDQFKHITRYDGDANAPIGVLWVEESIDQLITRLTG